MLHLNEVQVKQVERLITLLDDGFYRCIGDSPLHQQADGNVEFLVSLGNTIERAKGTSKVETSVVVYSSQMVEGQTRHFYANLDEALSAVEAWHKKISGFEDDVRVSEESPHLRIVR